MPTVTGHLTSLPSLSMLDDPLLPISSPQIENMPPQPPASPSPIQVDSEPLDATLQVQEWQQTVSGLWEPVLPDGRSLPAGSSQRLQAQSSMVRVSVSGPDTETTAQGLISWARATMAGTTPRLPQGVAISDFDYRNILSPSLIFNV
jgi:hypothetical protein